MHINNYDERDANVRVLNSKQTNLNFIIGLAKVYLAFITETQHVERNEFLYNSE